MDKKKQVKGEEYNRRTDGGTERCHSSGVKPGLSGDAERVKTPLSCKLSALCQSELLARDGAGCQGDTPPSSRTMALTNQPIHFCDVSSTGNSDVSVLQARVHGTVG